MHIVNIMFGKGGGGIEQAFVDYCEGLRDRGHLVTAVIQPGAFIEKDIRALGIPVVTLRNWNEWDVFAIHRLRKILRELMPDVVLGHANRAYSLAKKAGAACPIVALAQNYSTRRYTNADAVFATTRDLIEHLQKQGISADNIFHIPNMVRCGGLPQRGKRNDPPIIGTLGRFVAKKGFDVYIEALRLLKNKGYVFKAILGGNGEEEKKLKEQAKLAGLETILEFPGWVQDKKAFYTGIDVFCLPSLHEPFGIVLLEAFMYGAPVVATDSEGPRDFIAPEHDALIVPKGDAVALADALACMLDHPQQAANFAANAFVKTKTTYSIEAVAERIEKACVTITARSAAQQIAA